MKMLLSKLILGMTLVGALGGCAGLGMTPMQQVKFMTDAGLLQPPLIWH